MRNFPYICECGYNTMDSAKARAHADTHTAQEIRGTLAPNWQRILGYARGRMVFVCPVGFDSDSVNVHSQVFYIEPSELDDAGGYIACEYCESKCLRLDDVKVS